MPADPRIWFRKSDQWWYFTLPVEGGRQRQVRLVHGKANRPQALQRFFEHMARQGGDSRKSTRDGNGSPATPAAAPTTVFGVIDSFLEHCQRNLASATYDLYLSQFSRFVEFLETDLPADSIRPHHVQNWLDSESTWGPSTKNSAVRTIRRAYRWAVDLGHLDRYPLATLKAPTAKRREVILAESEFSTLLESARDAAFRDLLTFVWHTGCRPQEAVAIEARHLQLESSRVVLPASESKGQRHARVIYLDTVAREIIERSAKHRPVGPLLRNGKGSPWTRNAVRCRFRRLGPVNGRRLCLYHLRHSWATRALQRGVDPITVSVLMGHSSGAMVAEVYQHLAQCPDHMQQAAERATGDTGNAK